MGVQIPRPTFATHVFCTRCGQKTGWYLRRGSSWPNGGVEADYGDGRPRCPVHGGLLRTAPRYKRARDEYLGGKSYSEPRIQVMEETGE